MAIVHAPVGKTGERKRRSCAKWRKAETIRREGAAYQTDDIGDRPKIDLRADRKRRTRERRNGREKRKRSRFIVLHSARQARLLVRNSVCQKMRRILV